MRRPTQWLAGPNQIAHATDPADRWRTLCGATAVVERLAWPAERRCLVCEARAGVAAKGKEAATAR